MTSSIATRVTWWSIATHCQCRRRIKYFPADVTRCWQIMSARCRPQRYLAAPYLWPYDPAWCDVTSRLSDCTLQVEIKSPVFRRVHWLPINQCHVTAKSSEHLSVWTQSSHGVNELNGSAWWRHCNVTILTYFKNNLLNYLLHFHSTTFKIQYIFNNIYNSTMITGRNAQ